MLHLATHIRDVTMALMVIEEHIKTHPQPNQENPNKKQGRVLRIKRMRRKNKIMETMEEELKAMADLERRTDMPKDMGGDPSEKERAIAGTVIRKMMDDSDSEQEYKCISDRSGYDTIDKEKTLSSEMLLAIPNKRESRKYTTYLGRVD